VQSRQHKRCPAYFDSLVGAWAVGAAVGVPAGASAGEVTALPGVLLTSVPLGVTAVLITTLLARAAGQEDESSSLRNGMRLFYRSACKTSYVQCDT